MSGKKILVIGFILVLLVAIPVTVYLVQQQQRTKTGAVAATTLSLTPPHNPIAQGTNVKLTVHVDPGTNQVSYIKFTITYDPSKLSVVANSFKVLPIAKNPDGTPYTPHLLQGPIYTNGSIAATISVGQEVQYVIQNPTDIASVTFDTTNLTDTTTVSVDTTKSQVMAIGLTAQFNENVLLTAVPADITVGANITTTPTDTPTPTGAETTLTPTDTPTPTGAETTLTPTDTPTPTGAETTLTPTDTPTPTTQQTNATGPTCSSIVVNPSTGGAAPFTVNLTATGQDSSSTISKVTFDFGDGQTQDITDSSGIGTNSISVLQSHVYNTAGNYTATAVLTDAAGSVSPVGNCSVAISVNNGQIATTQNTTTTSNTTVTQTPTSLSPTGPSQLVTVGSIGAILTIIGAVLFLAL